MSGTPDTIYPSLTYTDAPRAIRWLCDAFGFTERLVVPNEDGTVKHSELSFGTGVVMVSSPRPAEARVGPREQQGYAQALAVFVDDPDAHHERAVAQGAKVLTEPRDEPFGGRAYSVEDLEGRPWYFGSYRPGIHWGSASE